MNSDLLEKIKDMSKNEQKKYMNVVNKMENIPAYNYNEAVLKPYNYWKQQPVTNINETVILNSVIKKDFLKESPKLPEGYVFNTFDKNNNDEMNMLLEFINTYYIGNPSFDMKYTVDHLKLFLNFPDNKPDLAVKLYHEDKLIGFISGSLKTFVMNEEDNKVGEVNFLAIHKDYRQKGFAPLLIDEITHRITKHLQNDNLPSIGFYATDMFLPKPFASAKYYHRPLNFEKLLKCGFINKKDIKNLEGSQKFYDVSDIVSEKLRKAEERDLEALYELYNEEVKKYTFYEKYTLDQFKYFFFDSPIVETYVFVDEEDDELIEDFVTFYKLNADTTYIEIEKKRKKEMCGPKGAKKMRNKLVDVETMKSDTINVLYLYFYSRSNLTRTDLFAELSRLGKSLNYDLINSLNIFESGLELENNKFMEGTNGLNYYFYNYKHKYIKSTQIAKMCL